MNDPKYFVYVENKLYGYFDPRMLSIDLVSNKDPLAVVFRAIEGSVKVVYEKIDYNEIRKDSDAMHEAVANEARNNR